MVPYMQPGNVWRGSVKILYSPGSHILIRIIRANPCTVNLSERYRGSPLLKNHSLELSSHYSMLKNHSLELSSHYSILKNHSLELSSHYSILKNHSLELSSHYSILKNHSLELSSHYSILKNHSLELSSHDLMLINRFCTPISCEMDSSTPCRRQDSNKSYKIKRKGARSVKRSSVRAKVTMLL